MNEAETRTEHIDPALKAAGWGVVEAKAWDEERNEGVRQAKNYAGKLALRFAYATNGRGVYGIDMETGKESETSRYPTGRNARSST